MKLEHLNYFASIKDYASINKASEQLYISHQALSKIIISLEEHFQTDLIERTSNGISFTENGYYLAQTANDIASLLEQAEFEIRANYLKKQSTTIKLHTDRITNAYIIPKLILFFKLHYPFMKFEITVHEAAPDNATIFSGRFKNYLYDAISTEYTFGLFSFFDTKPPQLILGSEVSSALISKNELLIAHKNKTVTNISTFVLNERELGLQSSIIDYIESPNIIYVKSQRQCYLALKNDYTGTITFKPSHYADTFDAATSSFSTPIYLYTIAIYPENNSEFLKSIQILLNHFVKKEPSFQ